jgi:hypothetical protein
LSLFFSFLGGWLPSRRDTELKEESLLFSPRSTPRTHSPAHSARAQQHPTTSTHTAMESETDDDCAASRFAARPELWALIAVHLDLVEAFRLMTVCRASKEGATEGLRTLPGLVVCGGGTGGEETSEVWRLDIGKLQWERMPSLTPGRYEQACCAVRGRVVMLGGRQADFTDNYEEVTASVEVLGFDSEAGERSVKVLPPLSCGPIYGCVAVTIQESESEQGQVLLIGGDAEVCLETEPGVEVRKVDLATGVCTPQPCVQSLPEDRIYKACTAARLADGRIVCVGNDWLGAPFDRTARLLEPPEQGSSSEASWQWRELPSTSVGRYDGRGCVLSDGRFAVFGGLHGHYEVTASCEVLTLDGDDERWDPLPPMRETVWFCMRGNRRVRHRRRRRCWVDSCRGVENVNC